MPLETWDVVVHGRSHRVELDRNAETGKHFLRVDGRIALKPFVDTSADLRFEVDGKPFALRYADGRFTLEDKGSRYHDATAPRASALSGRITIRRGLEHISVVADDVLLRIEKLSEGFKAAMGAGSGGGLLGAIATEASFQIAQKLTDTIGPPTIEFTIRSFGDLPSEVWCRFVQLPTDLITLFSEEVDPDCRVLVVPRQFVESLESARNKILVETTKTRAQKSKPHKFEMLGELDEVIDHLCGAGYPLGDEDLARATPEAREERERRKAEESARPSATPAPVAPAAPAGPRSFSGVSEVRWTAPLATVIGRDPELAAQMEADARVLATVYPKTTTRRVRVEPPMRRLGSERYDIVFLAGVFDDKTRFREVGGYAISLKDLIVQLFDNRVRMLWLASANDEAVARDTLEWVAGLNFYLVLTIARADDYPSMLSSALSRLAQGETLATITPELEATHYSRWLLFGGGEAVFWPQ